MQFGHTYDLVMSGVKTQTRRVWQPGDLFRVDFDDTVSITRYSQQSKKRYPVYVIGKTYTVQPGRGYLVTQDVFTSEELAAPHTES